MERDCENENYVYKILSECDESKIKSNSNVNRKYPQQKWVSESSSKNQLINTDKKRLFLPCSDVFATVPHVCVGQNDPKHCICPAFSL